MFQSQNHLNDARHPRSTFGMAEVWFDLANQPPQNSWQGGRKYRANVDTILAKDIGDSLCLNRISDLKEKKWR